MFVMDARLRTMVQLVVILGLVRIIAAVKCDYCGQEFVSLGRHVWRCKARVTSSTRPLNAMDTPPVDLPSHDNPRPVDPPLPPPLPPRDEPEDVLCPCGRHCKGRRGLKAHQRACGFFKGLVQGGPLNPPAADPLQAVPPTGSPNGHPPPSSPSTPSPSTPPPYYWSIRPGLKLPKTKSRWLEANIYFHNLFANELTGTITDLDTFVERAQNSVYDYFADTCGTIPLKDNSDFANKYADYSVKALKRALRSLKNAPRPADATELRYVSSLIRAKLASKSNTIVDNSDLDRELSTNFWSHCRKIFDTATNRIPKFDLPTCCNYFKEILRLQNRNKTFEIPAWIPTLSPPDTAIVIDPPTYQAVARAINKCKASSSACPLDQLSVIILKNCPILRTLLHRIITQCWASQEVPKIWKRGVSILIYKKGDPSDPANFRPITLQPVWYKIYATAFASSLHNFLMENNYLDRSLQKGFWKGIDGVTEHTEMLSRVLNTAKREQRSITVALLDLKNAFGEVHHELIASALRHHHAPPEYMQLFRSTYKDNFIVVAMDRNTTQPIRVERGVLQGDPSSPLLFNLCFNTLMLTIDQPLYKKLGFSWGPKRSRQQRAWLQFADDAAIIAADNASAQALLNVFQAWCAWSTMTIRLDKCMSFGMQRRDGQYVQTMPNIAVNGGQIPPVPLGDQFTYLGCSFGFDLKDESAKHALENKLTELLQITNELKVKAQTKLKILSLYIHSQIMFEIKLYDFPITWVEQKLDALCIRYMRAWLEMPVSACVGEVASLPKRMGGMGISSIKSLAQKMCLTKRHYLRGSANADVREIWAETSAQHVDTDQLIVSHDSLAAAVKALALDQQLKAVNHLFGLQLQGALAKSLSESVPGKNIELWVTTLNNISSHIFNFARKAFLQVLPTAANLKRWGRTQDPSCPLCASGQPQTNKHVLSNCSCPTALHRYTERHNAVLALLITWLRSNISREQQLYADLVEVNVLPVCDLFISCRPDIAIVNRDSIHVLELTVCHETNMISSHDYKKSKYNDIAQHRSMLAGNRKIVPHFIEVSTLGFIANITDFTKAIQIPNMPDDLKRTIVIATLKSSFSIYCNRNNAAIGVA